MAKKKSDQFEDNLKKLQAIVEKLEQGDLPLDEALESFSEGIRLADMCRKKLEEAESKALRALAQFVLFLAFVGAVLATAGVGSGQSGLLPWTLASIAALVVWWLANAKSPGLRDPDAPTGGAVTQKLPGNLANYKTK